MKAERIVFVDDKLEVVFSNLSEKDPIKKALVRAIKDIKHDTHIGRNVKKRWRSN